MPSCASSPASRTAILAVGLFVVAEVLKLWIKVRVILLADEIVNFVIELDTFLTAAPYYLQQTTFEFLKSSSNVVKEYPKAAPITAYLIIAFSITELFSFTNVPDSVFGYPNKKYLISIW